MKHLGFILTIACCLGVACDSISQRYDYNHIERTRAIGSAVFIRYDDTVQDIHIDIVPWAGTVFGCPTLSDREGHFLGYYNSRNLYDSIGRVAINGDSMAVGFFQNYLFQFLPPDEGLGENQNCAFVPISDSLYYLIYKSSETWVGAPDFAVHFMEQGKRLTSYSDGLYLTKVRVNPDHRLYILPEEKQTLLIDDLFQMRNLIFCKTPNGRDWWLIVPKALDSKACRLIIRENGDIEQLSDIEFSDNFWRVRSVSQVDVSPDGQYIARLIHRANSLFEDIIELFRFDRCEGTCERLRVDSLPLPEAYSSGADVLFSSNSRFLYVSMGAVVLQYDMEDEDPLAHRDTIARWDGEKYYGYPILFDSMWRLPNGKFLICGFSFTPFMHYIDDPDKKGSACQFRQRAIELPTDPLNEPYGTYIGGLPDFLPFRMGPLETPCSNETTSPDPGVPIKIFPNPAVDVFSIQCQTPIERVSLYLADGSLVMVISLDGAQDHYEFSIDHLAAGVYYVVCGDHTGQVIGTKKLVKI